MRGEVMLLSRNIIIQRDADTWGCQVVTAGVLEADFTMRYGSTVMDNVEVSGCSQKDTTKAALRWESATGASSSVTNCAIHSGQGWGINAAGSHNLHFANNMVFGFKAIGATFKSVKNVTFDSNMVADVQFRDFSGTDAINDKWAGVAICSLPSRSNCRQIHFNNNVVAGALWTGFTAPGHACGDAN